MAYTIKTKVLQVAARRLGGPRELRDYLQCPSEEVLSWMAGVAEPPLPVFLKALELVLDRLDAAERSCE